MCLRLVRSQLTNLSTMSIAKSFDAFLERCGMATTVRGENKIASQLVRKSSLWCVWEMASLVLIYILCSSLSRLHAGQ